MSVLDRYLYEQSSLRMPTHAFSPLILLFELGRFEKCRHHEAKYIYIKIQKESQYLVFLTDLKGYQHLLLRYIRYSSVWSSFDLFISFRVWRRNLLARFLRGIALVSPQTRGNSRPCWGSLLHQVHPHGCTKSIWRQEFSKFYLNKWYTFDAGGSRTHDTGTVNQTVLGCVVFGTNSLK